MCIFRWQCGKCFGDGGVCWWWITHRKASYLGVVFEARRESGVVDQRLNLYNDAHSTSQRSEYRKKMVAPCIGCVPPHLFKVEWRRRMRAAGQETACCKKKPDKTARPCCCGRPPCSDHSREFVFVASISNLKITVCGRETAFCALRVSSLSVSYPRQGVHSCRFILV